MLSWAAEIEACLAPAGSTEIGVAGLDSLAAFAARHLEIFKLRSLLAPGFFFFGANLVKTLAGVPQASFAGAGLSVERALACCAGEAAEFLSQFERPGDRAADEKNNTALKAPASLQRYTAKWQEGRDVSGPVRLKHFVSREDVNVPCSMVLRRNGKVIEDSGCYALSTGCAAGPTLRQAIRSGILELIERDAAAMWWFGGKPARKISTAKLDHLNIGAMLHVVRQGLDQRQILILDITTDLAIPCVAAVSVTKDRRNAVFGFGCGTNLGEACFSAVREVLQMELGQTLLYLKRDALGISGLDPYESMHLRRDQEMDCSFLEVPGGEQERSNDYAEPVAGTDDLDWLVARLCNLGNDVYYRDLTRGDFGIPCVKTLATGLQPCIRGFVSDRLQRQLNASDSVPLADMGYDIL